MRVPGAAPTHTKQRVPTRRGQLGHRKHADGDGGASLGRGLRAQAVGRMPDGQGGRGGRQRRGTAGYRRASRQAGMQRQQRKGSSGRTEVPCLQAASPRRRPGQSRCRQQRRRRQRWQRPGRQPRSTAGAGRAVQGGRYQGVGAGWLPSAGTMEGACPSAGALHGPASTCAAPCPPPHLVAGVGEGSGGGRGLGGSRTTGGLGAAVG